MQINDITINVNDCIINERNEQICNITNDVEIINDIYRDLNLLVNEQGCHINTISDNIEHSVAATDSALKHLLRAEQKSKHKTCEIL